VILQVFDLYKEGSFSLHYGYIYIAGITNLSVTFSLYFLVLFYLVAEKELAPNKPIAKFLCIKSILFFSFWQSVFIGALSFFDVIPAVGEWKKEQVATGLQDYIICIEMFFLSIAHIFVFPYQPYRDYRAPWFNEATIAAIRGSAKNFSIVVNQHDLIADLRTVYDPEHIKIVNKQQRELTEEETSILLKSVEDNSEESDYR